MLLLLPANMIFFFPGNYVGLSLIDDNIENKYSCLGDI